MPGHLAFLHTSPVHIDTFERLVKAADPGVRVEHVVAEQLLAEAQRVGAEDPGLVQRIQGAMAGAAVNGATMVVCTCSTIGGAAERTQGGGFRVARIDRAMADRAVELGPRVLVVAALESTLSPTGDLIRDSAARLGRRVEIENLLVAGAWTHFQHGNTGAYVEAVAAVVRAYPAGPNVVVLAQASMAPAAALLAGLGIEVLASPALGVQRALKALRAGR